MMWLLITGLGKQKMILGFPWLQKHNPIINWQIGTFKWQHIPWKVNFRKQIEDLLAKLLPKPTVTEEEDLDEWLTWTVNVLGTDWQDALISPLIKIQKQIMDEDAWINPETSSVWIYSKTNMATDMEIAENLEKEGLTDEQIVPPKYYKYLDIFNEKWASWFQDKQPWDHKIEMKLGFEPNCSKTTTWHQLNRMNSINSWRKIWKKDTYENLNHQWPHHFLCQKERWQTSALSGLPIFEWMDNQNAYPLPLISEIMDKLKGAKCFTKLNVWWGYNNIRIKEGDEWKAASKTNWGLFKPTVMFFGMCNSPTTFQSMMNSIFIEEI